LGITRENYLFVRDHRSRGCPHVFWRLNYTCKSAEIVHWEVGTGDDVDVAGRVLKKPILLGYNVDYNESSSSHGLVLQPPFNAYKEMLQEFVVVAGANDSSLNAALNKYKDQESRLDGIVYAQEKLKQQKLKVKEGRAEKNKAAEGLISTDPRFECVRG